MAAVYLKFIIHQVNTGEAYFQFPLLYPAFIRGRALNRGNTVLLLYLFLNFVFFCLFVCLFVRFLVVSLIAFFLFFIYFVIICPVPGCSGMCSGMFHVPGFVDAQKLRGFLEKKACVKVNVFCAPPIFGR